MLTTTKRIDLIPRPQVKTLFNSSLFIRIDELSAMATLRGGVSRPHGTQAQAILRVATARLACIVFPFLRNPATLQVRSQRSRRLVR
jgi:hypothetical protein